MKQYLSVLSKRHKTITVVLIGLQCQHVPMMTSREIQCMSTEQPLTKGSHWTEPESCIQSGYRTSRCKSAYKATENESTMNPNAATFESRAICAAPPIGQDLWKQLKRMPIPVVSGNKKKIPELEDGLSCLHRRCSSYGRL